MGQSVGVFNQPLSDDIIPEGKMYVVMQEDENPLENHYQPIVRPVLIARTLGEAEDWVFKKRSTAHFHAGFGGMTFPKWFWQLVPLYQEGKE